MTLAALNFASLGLTKGDIFAYAYVCTADPAMENMFHVNAAYKHLVLIQID